LSSERSQLEPPVYWLRCLASGDGDIRQPEVRSSAIGVANGIGIRVGPRKVWLR
jgi:hypothetical protein